jgi:hypothetical protein
MAPKYKRATDDEIRAYLNANNESVSPDPYVQIHQAARIANVLQREVHVNGLSFIPDQPKDPTEWIDILLGPAGVALALVFTCIAGVVMAIIKYGG